LTFLRRSSETEIFVAGVGTAGDRLSSIERLHLEQHRQLPYAWTPDSQSVLFDSDRDGPFHLFKQSTDQLTPDLLFGGDNSLSVVRPNPDYSAILFLVVPKPEETSGLVRLMELSFSGGSARQILADRDMHNFQCARAPSSVCVYSKDAPDRLLFFTFDLATGTHLPLMEIADPESYLQNWTLSPDGEMLALAKWHHLDNNPAIHLRPIKGGPERILSLRRPVRIASIDFAADGRSIWAVTEGVGRAQELLNVDLHGGIRSVFEENEKQLGWAIPSPDGRRLAFWEASGTSNAWLLQGF
jgi:hypothetical protein